MRYLHFPGSHIPVLELTLMLMWIKRLSLFFRDPDVARQLIQDKSCKITLYSAQLRMFVSTRIVYFDLELDDR